MGMIILDTARNATTYFWGERTSTLDWCEENYVVSDYIAEFWNCVTNGMFVVMAAFGIFNAVKHQQGKRVVACYVGLLFVGCGSACFHATLKYTTQLLDELPMLYMCALGFYSLVEADRKINFGWKLPVALAAFQTVITVTYILWVQSPIFHQAAFAITLCASVAFGHRRQCEMTLSNRTRRMFQRLLFQGFLGMAGGFLVWNLDNIFCHRLRTYRSHVGMPLDAILQLHGWWHVFTAYGSTYLLLWVHLTKLARLGHDHLFTIRHYAGFVPYITLKTPKKID